MYIRDKDPFFYIRLFVGRRFFLLYESQTTYLSDNKIILSAYTLRNSFVEKERSKDVRCGNVSPQYNERSMECHKNLWMKLKKYLKWKKFPSCNKRKPLYTTYTNRSHLYSFVFREIKTCLSIIKILHTFLAFI